VVLLPLRQRFEAHSFQLRRNFGDELSRRLRLVFTHLPQQLRDVSRPEEHAPGEHFVKHLKMSVRPSMRWAVPAACSGNMYHGGAGDDAFGQPP
jgi:hypothetical protein